MGVLSGKWCVITGAGRGIGEAIAAAFSREGASLALVARSMEQLEQVADVCRKNGAEEVAIYPVDLGDAKAVTSLSEKLLAAYTTVDVLVNNAGMGIMDTPTTGSPDDWDLMIALNLSAPMRLTHDIAPAMIEKGAGVIINMGSVAAIEPMNMGAAYAATKHGLRGWSLSCYQALRKDNIKVVLVNPGMVKTSMSATFKLDHPERMILPEDIAEACMLAIRTSPSACPQEITIRPVLPVS